VREADAAETIHGVAVAARDIGLLILGESGSGKSALAARMIADWPFGDARLVADDRVMLKRHAGRIIARSHHEIAGMLEIRGHGITQPRWLDAVVVRGLIRLSAERPPRLPEALNCQEAILGIKLPLSVLPQGEEAFQRLITIWPYFRGHIATVRSQNDPPS
jgi:HPr kinase/phosphorylase